ncbi:MAG: N-acetylmuramyl-L-alanine amidase, negative regulator of AmpC, AmpD [Parcubacteria group bacterium GW2011_GWA2_38_13]|nr:MAG: N-acetylmuramyl-L-alanine amidase, negative regulator of AmpC, AmpD [Parcubacteria group bacterium GW2011_GWA2_38_13]
MNRNMAIVSMCVLSSLPLMSMDTRKKTEVIIVHHSATSGGSVETIRRYHKEVNKWEDIGYHYVITNGNGGKDGVVHAGRSEELTGAHAGKGRNQNSLGVCLIGNDTFTEKQIEALTKHLATLCVKHKITPSAKTIQRHHEECPGNGIDLDKVIQKVKELMAEKS